MGKKRLAILGATGSIGTQALDVVRAHPNDFEVVLLTAHRNIDLLAQQAREFRPRAVIIGEESLRTTLRDQLEGSGVEVFSGMPALVEAVQHEDIDMVLTAMVGAV